MQSRDGKGRLLAPDGWPMGGLARVSEAVGFLQLSRSKVYQLVREGSLRSVQFGKSRACDGKIYERSLQGHLLGRWSDE